MGRKKQSQDSDDYDDDDSKDQQKFEVRRPQIQRLDKFKNLKKIVINVSMTQYPVVSDVAQALDWKIQTNVESGDWDVFWTDFSIDPDILIKMHLFQKINHYPGIHVIARKNLLGMGLMNLRKKFPQQYDFFPLTWMLPQQYVQFRQYFQNRQKGKCRTYIVKPQNQCQGRGIFLTRKLQDMENGKHYVVQRYLARPYLIDGLKFDFRIYVLFCGTDPLRLYLYNEGLARFATQKYVEPSSANLDHQYMHLTNYAINKNSPKFIFNNNTANMGVGHKRSLSCVYKQLAAKGLDVEELKRKIKDMSIKTIISGLPLMGHQYKCSQPEDYTGSMCFHILGLDVMINHKGQPYLIQVNHTPSFTTDTPLDYKIKFNLIKDSLTLLNVNVKKKTQLFNQCKQYNQDRLLTGKRHIFQGQDRAKMIDQAQAERDKWESKHLGGFQKIYPSENQQENAKFQQIIATAKKSYFQQNGSIRMKMEQKEAKKLIRSEMKRRKQSKQKRQGKTDQVHPQSQKIIIVKEEQTEINTPRVTPKTSEGKKNLLLNDQQNQQRQSQTYSPNLPKRNFHKMQSSLIRSQPQHNHRPPSQSLMQTGKLVSNTIRDIRDRMKTKKTNVNAIRKEKNQQFPNIQTQSNPVNSNMSDLFNKSELIGQKEARKKQKSLKHHNPHIAIYSQTKGNGNKLMENINRDIRQHSLRKGGNGGFVMPKIFCLNFEMQKKLDFLSMKKVQSAQQANNQ